MTQEGGPHYVPPAARIATFDNDGTLWVEYPMYTQVLFAFEQVKKLAPQHPEWKTKQPFKALLEGDMKTAGAGRRLGLFIHHTDAEREFAYDRKSHVGTLDTVRSRKRHNIRPCTVQRFPSQRPACGTTVLNMRETRMYRAEVGERKLFLTPITGAHVVQDMSLILKWHTRERKIWKCSSNSCRSSATAWPNSPWR